MGRSYDVMTFQNNFMLRTSGAADFAGIIGVATIFIPTTFKD